MSIKNKLIEDHLYTSKLLWVIMTMEEIVRRIVANSDLNQEEVMMAIEKKRAASEGYLTDEAAARLVAAEYGVKAKPEEPPPIFIKQLISGLNDVTIAGRVLLVEMPRPFSGRGRSGQVSRALIADKTGTIGVLMWNEKAELARKMQRGEIVKVLHGYVRRGRSGEKELHVGQRGDVRAAPSESTLTDFPSIENFVEKIANIKKASRKVIAKGVIRSMLPMRTFERKDGTQGAVVRIVLEDETGQIPVCFWNEKAAEVAEAKEGTPILLINARVSGQEKELELHAERSTHVELPTSSPQVLRIKDLKEGMRIAFIEGGVATKPVTRNVVTRKGESVAVTSFELENGSGKTWVSAWRNHAKRFEGLPVGTRVSLRNAYVGKGFGNRLEITTRASTEIEIQQ